MEGERIRQRLQNIERKQWIVLLQLSWGTLLRKAITKATKETETNRIIKTEMFPLPETTITKLKQGWEERRDIQRKTGDGVEV